MNSSHEKSTSGQVPVTCPSEEDLSAYCDRALQLSDLIAIEAHIHQDNGCAHCAATVAAIQHLSWITSELIHSDVATRMVTQVENELTTMKKSLSRMCYPQAVTPNQDLSGVRSDMRLAPADMSADTLIHPQQLSETIATQSSFVARLVTLIDSDIVKSLFGRVIRQDAQKWGVAPDRIEDFVDCVIQSLSATIREACGKLQMIDGMCYKLIRVHLQKYIPLGSANVCGSAEEFVNWRNDYKRCILEWVVHQVRADIKHEEWRWLVYWRTEVAGISDRQVAAELGITEAKVLIAKCQVEQKVQEWLNDFLFK